MHMPMAALPWLTSVGGFSELAEKYRAFAAARRSIAHPSCHPCRCKIDSNVVLIEPDCPGFTSATHPCKGAWQRSAQWFGSGTLSCCSTSRLYTIPKPDNAVPNQQPSGWYSWPLPITLEPYLSSSHC